MAQRKSKVGIKVVYSASRNLYPYMLPSITSLLEHNKVDKIYLLIEDDEMPYEIPKECECINVSGQEWFKPGSANYRTSFTYLAMIRGCYASLLPEEDRIIQLDVDTIVNGDLSPLWKMDLDGKYLAACEETRSAYRPYGPDYYNIGVAVFNLTEIRKDGKEEEVINLLNAELLPFVDQDAWNRVAAGKIADLDSKYNQCFVTEPVADPVVIHFAGYSGWWIPQNIPGREYLDKYRHLFKEEK